MNFTESVTDGFMRYYDFSGRSSRSAYWWWQTFGFLGAATLAIIDHVLGLRLGFQTVFQVVMIIPGIAVQVRRLHDIGRSAWWTLLIFAVLLAGIIGSRFLAANHFFGFAMMFISVIGIIASWILILVWDCTASQPHTNRFGHEPA